MLKEHTYFDKTDSFIVKGIAILFMVLHHCVGLYYNSFDLSWYSMNCSDNNPLILLLFSTAGKVCVPLFTIISGYGITKSYIKFSEKNNTRCKNIKFCLSHLIQFFSTYWIIFLLTAPFTYINVFERYINNHSLYKGIFFFVIDFLGIQPRLSWYVRTIIILYLAFPLLHLFVRKVKIFSIFISFIPWILKLLIKSAEINIDSVIFCILPFVTGIYFSLFDSLDNLKRIKNTKYKFLSLMLVGLFFILRVVFSVYIDYFFSLSLICFATLVLADFKYLKNGLVLLGKNSANIWLIHGTIISLFPAIPLPKIVKYLVILLTALFVSMLIEFLKQKSGYCMKIKQLRTFVER